MSRQHGRNRSLEPVEAESPPRSASSIKPKPRRNRWLTWFQQHPEYAYQHQLCDVFGRHKEERRYARWLFEHANPDGLVT